MQTTMGRRGVESQQFDYEKRRYNDTVTWLAEVLPGSMRTPFEYRFDGRELYASDGSALEPIFDDAIEQARMLPRYEQRRRSLEKNEYQDMLAMMTGELPNTMVITSDFPPELMDATEDVGGYNATRKQTMLRVITRTASGTLMMYSQSLDGSNRRALEAMRNTLSFDTEPGELLGQRMHLELEAHEQEFLIDRLTGVYDRSMQAQYGGEWYAGQRDGQRTNTYDFICQQRDLIEIYLATTQSFTGGFKDYSLAAAMRESFLGISPVQVIRYEQMDRGAIEAMLLTEMYNAGGRAQALGATFSGCGTSIESRTKTSAGNQLEDAGYGNQADKPETGSEKLVWKKGTCRIENCPTRPGKTEVAQCSVCRGCQHWFDRGRDPAKLYSGIKQAQKTTVTIQFGNHKETKLQKDNNE